MNVLTYQAYFEKFKTAGLVNSIYEIDLLDLDTAANDLRSGKYKPDHLVMESFTVLTLETNADSIFDQFNGAILVLSPASLRSFGQTEKTALLNATYQKVATIKRAMIHDKYNTCGIMRGLEVEAFVTEKIGPVLDQMYGWRLQFQLNVPLNDTV
ncbi:MAG: hypothetical protein PHZ02_15200 [Desulfocapsaceae bacterium]|nr:hypothetical protein [Desulfocapsaceae bacterium]